MPLQSYIDLVLHPERYHGAGRSRTFFEGWYFKLVSADEKTKLALIPGIMLGDDAHAFVQVLDGVSGQSSYYRFAAQDFSAAAGAFDVSVGRSNHFSASGLTIDIPGNDATPALHGSLHFGETNPWPVTWMSPGAMGWYGWVPAMECYHGVVSFDHVLEGTLLVDGKPIDFSGGRGYIEKDWGKSFPQAWVWMQTNHFTGVRACLTASTAIIPWLQSSFRGLLAAFWLEGRLFPFASYTGARIEGFKVDDNDVCLTLVDRHYRLEISADRPRGGLLHAPTRLDMGRRISETLDATIAVRLHNKGGSLLFEGTGRHAGLEVEGDIERLVSYGNTLLPGRSRGNRTPMVAV